MTPPFPIAIEATPRRWPVRLIMVAIVFALVLPGLVFCGVLLNQVASSERARSQQVARAAAVRAADALDRELGNLSTALLALSTSPSIDINDLAGLYKQASAVAAELELGIVYSDVEGQQLVNTRRPFNVPLPRMQAMDTLNQAVGTRRAAVSSLYRGAVTNELSIVLDQPVIRGDQVRGVLGMSLQPLYLSNLILRQGVPPGWRISVTDASNRIIARSLDPAGYIGRTVTPEVIERGAAESSSWTGLALDGSRVFVAMQRAHMADWHINVTAPLEIIEAPLQQTIMLLAITGVVTLSIACLLAWQLAHSVAAPLQRLGRAGQALAQGLPVLGVRSAIAEVDAVSSALVQATRDLRARADALAAERAQLAAIIETVPVGLVITDLPSGRVIAGNRKLDLMLRHTLRRSDGTSDYGEWIAHHADGTLVQAHEFPLAQIAAGAQQAELQCLYRRGDGTQFWIQVVAAPIRGPDGVVSGGVAALLDIDEVVRAREEKARFADELEAQVAERTAALKAEGAARAAAEEQLRQAQKMEAVGQLTGGIAHDFNNLLTIVIGSLDLLRRRAVDDRTARLLDNALEGATRAATLTARLLAFSRRQPLLPQPVDLNALVGGMSDLLHRTLGEAIQVETLLAPGVWQTLADPNQLENALLNLAVNGRDAIVAAAGPNPRLVIETHNAVLDAAALAHDPDVTPGDYVRVSVADSGTGMPPEVVARVFEPFYTTKPQGQGTGLGLSQVHGFIKQSGGHVDIRTNPGAGTTVTLYLPRASIVPAPEALTADPVEEPPTAGLVVLVVEDDGGVRRYSVEALRDLGHTVIEADGGEAALRLLDAHPEIAVLLTDVVLPGMDGIRLAAEARRRHPGLPVLFASGYTGGTGLGRLPESEPLLHKPFTVQALAAKLREVLDEGHPVRPAGLEPATKPL